MPTENHFDGARQLPIPAAPNSPQAGPSSDSIAFVLKTYLAHSSRSLAATTHKRYAAYLSEFVQHVTGMSIDDLRPYHLVTWIEGHLNWKKSSTLAHAANAVRSCFGWARKMGMISADPFVGVRYVSHDTRPPITTAEHEALLRRTRDSNFRDFLVFLWESGMRPDELVRMEWSWVREDLGAIVFEIHKTRKKTGLIRQVPLTPAMLAVLARNKLRRPTSTLVFMTLTGRPWKVSSNLALKFRRARERARIRPEVTLYSYRHSEATRLIASGTPDILAANILGHADTRMLRRYAHPQLGMLKEAMMRASAQELR